MARTLGFHPKGKGSIPFNLRLFLDCYARSSFSLFLRPRSDIFGYAPSRIRISFFFLFNFFLLVFGFFLLNADLYFFRNWATSRLSRGVSFYKNTITTRLVCFRRVRFFKTIQRGPMAHRQWSQEQYRFSFFTFFLRVAFPAIRPRLLVSVPQKVNISPNLHLFGTALLGYRSTLITFYRLIYSRFFFFKPVLL